MSLMEMPNDNLIGEILERENKGKVSEYDTEFKDTNNFP
jgi:hypothetical protein